MTVINNNETDIFFRNVCIVMIWCIAVYSSIIQNIYFKIQNGMLIFGSVILVSYILANRGMVDFSEFLTDENRYMLYFMVYILLVGFIFSPYKNNHISQWIRCMEYLFIQIVIASTIKRSGTNTIHSLLLVESMVLAIAFLRSPVDYLNSGRYSISNDVNPNGLGMGFAAGIWAVLYRQQKSKLPIVLIVAIIALFGYCILLTGSRKSLIAAGLTIVLWFFFCFLPSLKGRGFILGMATFLVFLFLTIIIGREFLSLYADSKIAARMENLLYEVSEGGRSNMYREGYELLKTNPLFGIGFQGFAYYFGGYSHATLVEVPVSGGIIGAIIYFSMYYISFKRQVQVYRKTKGVQEMSSEHKRIKMVLILFVMVVFYTTCIIHPYQFDSYILFGIIFGETAYLESRLNEKTDALEN